MATRSTRKVILNCKTGKRLGDDLYLKGAEEKFPIACFKEFKREVRNILQGRKV